MHKYICKYIFAYIQIYMQIMHISKHISSSHRFSTHSEIMNKPELNL